MRGKQTFGALLGLGLLAGVLGMAILADGRGPDPSSAGRSNADFSRPPGPAVYRLAPLPVPELRAAHPPRKGQALRFAEPSAVSLTPERHGRWSVEGDRAAWQLAIEAPGALNLNFAFERYKLPEGALLEFLAPDGTALVRSFTAADTGPDGGLWTPVFAGEQVDVRLTLPADRRGDLELEVSGMDRAAV